MEDVNHTQNADGVVNQQIEKNKLAIEKLRWELNELESRIIGGEKTLEDARVLLSRYEDISERIVNLNNKMKLSPSVPQKISSHFDSMMSQAEILEGQLADMGISSVEDFNRLIKVVKDNREMLSKYTEIVANLEKQNEYYQTVGLEEIVKPEEATVNKDSSKKDFKGLIIQLKDTYGSSISNVKQLMDEMKITENKIRALVVRQSISQEIFDKMRIIEEYVVRFEKCKERLRKLNADMLDDLGNIKDITKREFYVKNKSQLDKQIKLDMDFLYANNMSNFSDFDEKDGFNRSELQELNLQIEFNNKKMGLLNEIYNQFKKMSKRE